MNFWLFFMSSVPEWDYIYIYRFTAIVNIINCNCAFPAMTCHNIFFLSLTSPNKVQQKCFQSNAKEKQRNERCQNDFLALSWRGTTRQTETVSQRGSRVKLYLLLCDERPVNACPCMCCGFLLDLECDIWRPHCLYVCSGMDWQLRRHSISELGYKYRGGAG